MQEQSTPPTAAPAKQKRAPNAQTLRIAHLEEEVERLNAKVSSLELLFARVTLLEQMSERDAVFGVPSEDSLLSGMGEPTRTE
jgi:hypothetical protein